MQVGTRGVFVQQSPDSLISENLRLSLNKNNWRHVKKLSSNVALAITNKCNMSCKVCYARDDKGGFRFDEMAFETIKHILCQIGKNKKVILMGGEPTLRDDLFDIIQAVKLSGNMPLLCTNGIKLANKHYVDKLVLAGIKKIYFSIDGLDVNSTVCLRGDSTYHSLKLKALNNLKESNKIKVCLSSTIAGDINEEEIRNLLNFAIENNSFIKGIIFFPFNPIGWYQIPASAKLHSSDIINMLSKTTRNSLSKEYFDEFNRLRYNLDKLLNGFNKVFPLYKDSVYVKIIDRKIQQFIQVRDLRKINCYFERKTYYKLSKYVFQKDLWRFALQALIQPAFVEVVSYKKDGLNIRVDNIDLPTHDFSSLSGVTIALIEWQGDIFSTITTY